MSIYSAHVKDAAELLFVHLCIPLLRINSTFYWIVPPVRVVVAALFSPLGTQMLQDPSGKYIGWWDGKLLEDLWSPVSIYPLGVPVRTCLGVILHWKIMKVDVDHSFTLIRWSSWPVSRKLFTCPLHPTSACQTPSLPQNKCTCPNKSFQQDSLWLHSARPKIEVLLVRPQLPTYPDMGVSLNGGTPKTPQNDHF